MIIVKNNRLYYELEIEEKITIIRGDSATGKTTLIEIIWQAQHYGDSSGIDLISEVPCRVLTGENWKLFVENAAESTKDTREKSEEKRKICLPINQPDQTFLKC